MLMEWIKNDYNMLRFYTGTVEATSAFMVGNSRAYRLILKTQKYCDINHGDKGFFSICNNHKCLSYLFPLHLNIYVIGPRPL